MSNSNLQDLCLLHEPNAPAVGASGFGMLVTAYL